MHLGSKPVCSRDEMDRSVQNNHRQQIEFASSELVFITSKPVYAMKHDSVWHKGLHLKLLKIIKCKKMTNFIMELLYTRTFVLVTSDGQKSRPHRLKNGVSQGSVLAPTLCNIYTSNFPQQLLIGMCMQTTLL